MPAWYYIAQMCLYACLVGWALGLWTAHSTKAGSLMRQTVKPLPFSVPEVLRFCE